MAVWDFCTPRYGPLNYNSVEECFFHRLAAGRPIPVPGSGKQITQLGHVKDLATAFTKVLGNDKAKGQIYNISGEKVWNRIEAFPPLSPSTHRQARPSGGSDMRVGSSRPSPSLSSVSVFVRC